VCTTRKHALLSHRLQRACESDTLRCVATVEDRLLYASESQPSAPGTMYVMQHCCRMTRCLANSTRFAYLLACLLACLLAYVPVCCKDEQGFFRGWQVSNQQQAPRYVQQVVATMVALRCIEHEPASILMQIPNELLFLIFSFLPWQHSAAPRIAPPVPARLSLDVQEPLQ
jgi:hypothetical protein